MPYTPKRETFAPVRLQETARAMVSAETYAPVLYCAACLRECDTYGDEFMREDTANAILALMQHTLYDHISPVAIHQTRVETVISWEA